MPNTNTRSLSVFAPAKINLHLHITGKRDDGYHLLDSLVCFTDIGDTVTIEEDRAFSFRIEGPFARCFTTEDRDSSPQSSNLVTRAVWALAKATGKTPKLRLTLKKNVPLGSGIGGGSSDAAATLWALIQWWNLPTDPPYLKEIMANLGSDITACFSCKTLRMQGTGNDISNAPNCPELPVLLVHPGKPCATRDVYQSYQKPFSDPAPLPATFEDTAHFIDVLKSTSNDLTSAALKHVPDITDILDTLNAEKSAFISRMSGSGSTCFALFEQDQDCMDAAEKIIRDHPEWWVRCGTIGTPVRY